MRKRVQNTMLGHKSFINNIDLPMCRPLAFPSTIGERTCLFPSELVQYFKESNFEFVSMIISSIAVLIHRFTGQLEFPIQFLPKIGSDFIVPISLTESLMGIELIQSIYHYINQPLGSHDNCSQVDISVAVLDSSVIKTVSPDQDDFFITMTARLIDFLFYYNEKANRIEMSIRYNRHMIRPWLVESLNRGLFSLLEDFCSIKQVAVNRIRLIDPCQLLKMKSSNYVLHHFYFSIPKMIEKIVMSRKKNPALHLPSGKKLSYEVLWDRVLALSSHIRDQKKPINQLGIIGSGTLLTIIAALACLHTGVTFISIPQGSSQLQKTIIANHDLSYCISDQPISSLKDVDFITEEQLFALPSQPDIAFLEKGQDAIVAYYYTSGKRTARRPVPITAKILFDQISLYQDICQFSDIDRVMCLDQSADIMSLHEFLCPILNGLEIYLLPFGPNRTHESVAKFIQTHRITFLHLDTSLLRELITRPTDKDYSSVTRVLTHSSKLKLSDIQHIKSLGSMTLYHAYTIAELGGIVSFSEVQPGVETLIYPIAKDATKYRLILLDENNQPIPDGAIGRLYYQCDERQLAYLQSSPRMQASVKKISLFGRKSYCYDTGDKGRQLPGGKILLTKQRKNSGHYVSGSDLDLERTAEHLVLHPSITQSFILPHKTEPGKIELVAFIACHKTVTSKQFPQIISEIKTYVNLWLPESHVPHRIIPLESFSYDKNGQIDIGSLTRHPALAVKLC